MEKENVDWWYNIQISSVSVDSTLRQGMGFHNFCFLFQFDEEEVEEDAPGPLEKRKKMFSKECRCCH